MINPSRYISLSLSWRLLLATHLVTSTLGVQAQGAPGASKPAGWLETTKPGLCRLSISPDMTSNGKFSDGSKVLELATQAGLKDDPKIQALRRESEKSKASGNPTLIVSQRDGLKTYFRIMVEAMPDPTTKRVAAHELDDATLKEAAKTIQANEFNASAATMGNRLISPMSPSRTVIGGLVGIQVTYTRQLDQRPPVRVEQAYLFDNGRTLKVTISWRISETALYEAQLRRALASLIWL